MQRERLQVVGRRLVEVRIRRRCAGGRAGTVLRRRGGRGLAVQQVGAPLQRGGDRLRDGLQRVVPRPRAAPTPSRARSGSPPRAAPAWQGRAAAASGAATWRGGAIPPSGSPCRRRSARRRTSDRRAWNLRRMRFTCEVMVLSSSTTLAASISCWRLRTCPGWRASACTIQNSVSDSSTTLPSHCACHALGVERERAAPHDARRRRSACAAPRRAGTARSRARSGAAGSGPW